MKRVIKLPDVEAIEEFVNCSRKSNKYINPELFMAIKSD